MTTCIVKRSLSTWFGVKKRNLQIKWGRVDGLPRLMLRPTAPKNPEPDKENGLDFSRGSTSVSVDVYMIPALKIVSATS